MHNKNKIFIEKIYNSINYFNTIKHYNYLLLTNTQYFNKNFFFLKKNSHINFYIHNIVKKKLAYNIFFKFKYYRFVLFAGLGYKRKFLKKKNIMFSYIADRHWILYKFNNFSTVIPAKRRSFLFLSSSKNFFNQDYNFYSSLRQPYIYKMKGFLDTRVKRRFIFIRRLKLKGIKTKLSKKQQML